MTVYLFEDNASSLISKLLVLAYRNDPSMDIRFTGGCGNLINVAGSVLSDPSVNVVAYIDMVPNSGGSWSVYSTLRDISRLFSCRLIVFPIVCAEYYYIKSLSGLPVFHSPADGLLARSYYYSSPFLDGHKESSYSTFEKFCKLYCEFELHRCCYIKRKGNAENDTRRVYNIRPCPCSCPMPSCPRMSVEEKALRLLTALPVAPYSPSLYSMYRMDRYEAWAVHRQLVDEFNDWTDSYARCDAEGFYGHLSYIK